MVREGIDEMVLDGATLDEIERELIELVPLSEDSRAALWLYAWGRLERQRPLALA